MNNLPMISKKENIFQRLIKFIKNIFETKTRKTIEIFQEEIDTPEERIRERFKVNNLNKSNKKVDNKTTMKEIIDIIEKNPQTLETLDINKLVIIDKYYMKKIDQYKRILNNEN